jgi:hypothetical protein
LPDQHKKVIYFQNIFFRIILKCVSCALQQFFFLGGRRGLYCINRNGFSTNLTKYTAAFACEQRTNSKIRVSSPLGLTSYYNLTIRWRTNLTILGLQIRLLGTLRLAYSSQRKRQEVTWQAFVYFHRPNSGKRLTTCLLIILTNQTFDL